jgi:drug/metabolite transporter (DMT)-like permease
MSASIHPFVFLALAFALAGSSVIPGKVLSDLPPFAACAGSAAVGLAVLLPFALREARAARGVRGGGASATPPRAAGTATILRALPLLAAQALFGMALFRVLLMAALARTSAADVGIATSATPAITAILAAVFLKERIEGRKILGIVLVVAGVALLEAGPGFAGTGPAGTGALGSGRLAGLALAIGAAASESVFNVMSKRIPAALGPTRTSAAVTALALVMLAAVSAARGERVAAADLGPARLAAFAYYGIFASALAYLCWFRGIKKVPASTAGIFSGLMPLSGFALSVLCFGERPGALGLAGAALALAGVTLCASSGLTSARFAAMVSPCPIHRRRTAGKG